MERDSWLHGAVDQQPLFSLYKSHNNIIMEEPFLSRPNFSPSSNFQSKGILKAPPLSLIHSAPPPQPPLLPLPASLPRRSFSCPPPAIKIGTRRKPRNHAKSTKSSTSTNNNSKNNNIPKKEEKIKPPKKSSDTVTTVASTQNFAGVAHCDNSVDMLPNSWVFTISPPPSSLPLPTFSLRPKLACNAAATAGATDDLRRILRLQ